MRPIELSYGPEGFREIKDFLNTECHKDYTLSIYNNMEQATLEVIGSFESFPDVIAYVSNIEHDFPEWIGVNELSESYVVGMNFTRGRLSTPGVYEWCDGKLIPKI